MRGTGVAWAASCTTVGSSGRRISISYLCLYFSPLFRHLIRLSFMQHSLLRVSDPSFYRPDLLHRPIVAIILHTAVPKDLHWSHYDNNVHTRALDLDRCALACSCSVGSTQTELTVVAFLSPVRGRRSRLLPRSERVLSDGVRKTVNKSSISPSAGGAKRSPVLWLWSIHVTAVTRELCQLPVDNFKFVLPLGTIPFHIHCYSCLSF